MDNKERVSELREVIEEALKMLNTLRIYLEALDADPSLVFKKAQRRWLIEDIQIFDHSCSALLTPEVINPDEN